MTKTVLKIISLWIPPLIWASVIFTFSSLPTKPTTNFYWVDFLVKKSAHIFEYGVFASLLYRAFKESGEKKRNAGLFAILVAILYATSDEFHQSFTPGRQPTVRDIVFDTIGAVSAIYLIWNILPLAPRRLRTWAKKLQLI